MSKWQPLTVYLPDTRGVHFSRYGSGNAKLGFGMFTYSRLPGRPSKPALGSGIVRNLVPGTASALNVPRGTCPGASDECQAICFAAHPVAENGPVAALWATNSRVNDVPEIPADCQILRLHVSGDFDSVEYVENWIARLTERPDVIAFAYTRSWRVEALLPALERLRALPNVELFASMDASVPELPPVGWRRAWILRTEARPGFPIESRLTLHRTAIHDGVEETPGGPIEKTRLGDLMTTALDGVPSYVCPEETGRKKNCVDCGYCFLGRKHDVTFLEH